MEESGVPVYLPTSQAKAGGFRFSVFVTKVLLRPRSPPQVIPPSLLSRKPPRCTRDMHPKGAIRTLHLHLPEADIRRIKKKKSATIKPQFRGSERRRRPDCHETAGFCANALRDETGPPRSGARSEDSETFRSLPNLLRSSPAWRWGTSTCRGDGRAYLRHRGLGRGDGVLPGILARRLELGFLGPDPAVDVGGGFVGTRFAEALSWHRRELRRAWEGRVLAPTRHRRLSRQPWWGLSLHPSLVHAAGF